MCVRLDGQYCVIRHTFDKAHILHWPVLIVGFTGIADQHLESQADGQVGCITRKLAGTDHQNAPAGSKGCAQSGAIKLKSLVAIDLVQADFAAGQVQVAADTLVLIAARQQRFNPVSRG